MYAKYYLNRDWMFTSSFEGVLLLEPMKDGKLVDIPHTFRPTGYNYIDVESQRAQCVYQKVIFAKDEWKGKRIILSFEGIAQKAGVYVNGVALIIHEGNSTPFHVDIDSKINFGEDNLITIIVDSREGLNQPPFSGADPVDTLPFGGIYRDVYLTIKEKISMNEVFYRTETTVPPNTKGMNRDGLAGYTIPGRLRSSISLSPDAARMAKEHRIKVRQFLNEKEISYQPLTESGETETVTGPVHIWDIDSPTCYSIRTELLFDDTLIDTYTATVGFRSIAFDQSGFHLNGRRVKIRGIIRHQSFPYVGYAMPESMQRLDGRILKEELHVNAVRCYGGFPSPHFLDECDKRGILVFCEVPGYRNIGDAEYKEVHIKNVREMVIEGRNHPSIFMWGVRINGAVSSALDKDAARVAHELDSTRLTGGERLERDMPFDEDIYSYTDLSFSGKGDPLLSKEEVTSDMERPYIVSGYLGESFPVKPTDSYKRKARHIMLAAGILDAQAFIEDIAGSFLNCMCDHISLAEFASEDGMVYHGVMDAFRNKKPVAALYSTQNNPAPELSVYPPFTGDRERWEGFGDVYIMTNSSKVRVYRDDEFICEYDSSDSNYSHMRHGPLLMDDFLGDVFEDGDDVKSDQAKRLKKLLNQMSIGGLSSFLQPGQIMDRLMSKIVYRMNRRQLLALYEKYVSKNHVYRFDGVDSMGKVEISTVLAPSNRMFLKADSSGQNFIERHGYDVICVRIHVNNEHGQLISNFSEPVFAQTEGPIEIIGPAIIPLRGGCCGTYLKSTGVEGEAKLILRCADLTPVELSYSILRISEDTL